MITATYQDGPLSLVVVVVVVVVVEHLTVRTSFDAMLCEWGVM